LSKEIPLSFGGGAPGLGLHVELRFGTNKKSSRQQFGLKFFKRVGGDVCEKDGEEND